MHRQPRAIPVPAVAAHPQSWETATLMLSEAPQTSLKQHPSDPSVPLNVMHSSLEDSITSVPY